MSMIEPEQTPYCVFRWHISRLFDDAKQAQRFVHVTITSETEAFRELLRERGPEGIGELPEDHLAWWHGDDYEFEGYTTEATLLGVYFERHVFGEAEPPIRPPDERGLKEDMVLLQFVPDCSKDRFDAYYGRLKAAWEDNAFPDVTRLATLEPAVWLDFTRAARRMAKTMYQRVAGTRETPPEEGYASER